ncbi:NADH-quinone oxidoreductase subunit NuoE [Chloroflexota bacterium]
MSQGIDLSLLDPVLQKHQGQEDALIGMLQEIQEVYSYLPEEALNRLSQEAKVPMSRIYAVATFYAQFYLNPRGRQTVRVCRGTACHVRGGPLILEAVERELGITEGETTPDLEYSLETVACIGACALAPTMVMNQNTYGKMTPNKVADVLSRKGKKEQEIA